MSDLTLQDTVATLLRTLCKMISPPRYVIVNDSAWEDSSAWNQ